MLVIWRITVEVTMPLNLIGVVGMDLSAISVSHVCDDGCQQQDVVYCDVWSERNEEAVRVLVSSIRSRQETK